VLDSNGAESFAQSTSSRVAAIAAVPGARMFAEELPALTSFQSALQVKKVELVPGGSSILVTKHNKKYFVELVVEWHLDKSIASAFAEFKQGFYSVASGSSLVLFNHHELELLVCGLPHLDFHALQNATVYEGGYGPDHPTVRAFWNTVHSLTVEEKKRLLSFVTGCDRAPMGGLGKMRMMIQRAGEDSERLPTAHTCFNVLLLPEYSDPDKLKRKIMTAISNAEGFGLQ
jgi:ubiquitin-protein ligase E3 A